MGILTLVMWHWLSWDCDGLIVKSPGHLKAFSHRVSFFSLVMSKKFYWRNVQNLSLTFRCQKWKDVEVWKGKQKIPSTQDGTAKLYASFGLDQKVIHKLMLTSDTFPTAVTGQYCSYDHFWPGYGLILGHHVQFVVHLLSVVFIFQSNCSRDVCVSHGEG